MEDKAITWPLPWQWFPFRITGTRPLLGVSQLGVMWPALLVPLTGVKWTHDPGWLKKRPCGIRDILEIGHFQSHHPPIGMCLCVGSCWASFDLWPKQLSKYVWERLMVVHSSTYSLRQLFILVCWVLPASHAKKGFKLYFYSLYYSFEIWEWWG